MELCEVLEKRRSVRKYLPNDVPDEDLEAILISANTAPSAGNLQAFRIMVVKDPKKKKALAEASYGQNHVSQAPVVIAIMASPGSTVAKYGERGRELYSVQDGTIFAAYLQLAAVERGLATVWVGAFDEQAVLMILGIKPFLRPIALLPLGYPAIIPEKTKRKTISELMVV